MGHSLIWTRTFCTLPMQQALTFGRFWSATFILFKVPSHISLKMRLTARSARSFATGSCTTPGPPNLYRPQHVACRLCLSPPRALGAPVTLLLSPSLAVGAPVALSLAMAVTGRESAKTHTNKLAPLVLHEQRRRNEVTPLRRPLGDTKCKEIGCKEEEAMASGENELPLHTFIPTQLVYSLYGLTEFYVVHGMV